MPFVITPNVQVETEANGQIRHLQHPHEPYTGPLGGGQLSPVDLATSYLADVAGVYGFDAAMVPETGQPERPSTSEEPRLEFADEKQVMETTTVSFAETYRDLPIWEAGVSVVILGHPLRVTSSYSTLHRVVVLDEPRPTDRELTPENATPERVAELLGLEQETARRARAARRRGEGEDEPPLRITATRALIYRYEPELRYDPESRQESDRPLSSGPPTLPLPDVSAEIRPDHHYVVTEVLFTLALPDWGPLHWRAFFERQTGAVLYLRAFVACANGFVFITDPITAAGGPPATGAAAALNARRTRVELPDLQAQIALNPLPLAGRFVTIRDFEPPLDPPPTEPFGHFLYGATTTNFSAVNAYYHLDALFQLMEGMGFIIGDYFDETAFNPGFPVPVDHDGFGGSVNAHALGNSTGTGSGGFGFGRAAAATTVGIADDARVVAHEFCHALLWDSVHSPNFGFAHSAGDSLGAILNDPGSQAPDRFVTFPWVNIGRRHDRPVGGGWAWGGVNDVGGYSSEQILCTTLFRAYRATGGDSAELNVQRYAARALAYLIIRAIGSLATSPITPTPTPNAFVTALINADLGTQVFDSQPGGALGKVIRWAFEQQGLFQPPGAPLPVTTVGAPPPVDVYIDDGRNGQYVYNERFWDTTNIWNRLAPDGKLIHETPVVGKKNYAYVRIGNRGTLPAGGVVVRGYHCKPAAGLVWPDDWTPMRTTAIAVPGSIAPGAQVVVGPFEWIPAYVGHETLMMSVSAGGDIAVTDPGSFAPAATGPSPAWRLVPFDNNLAQRSVIPVPGGGGRRHLAAAFRHRRFWVKNPFDRTARVEVRVNLSNFLLARGWGSRWENAGGSTFSLGPRGERMMKLRLIDGQNFTTPDLVLAGGATVRVDVLIDGLVVGGLSYFLDPKLRRPAREISDEEAVERRAEEEEEEEERGRHEEREEAEEPERHEDDEKLEDFEERRHRDYHWVRR